MDEVHNLPALPPRPADAHKGTFGTLLILGGSKQMIGAPMLAALAAYRAGVGLVQVAMPLEVLAPALSIVPEAIGLPLESDGKDAYRLQLAMHFADAVIAGPGLGGASENEALLRSVYQVDKPAVLDADALNWLGGINPWPADFRARAILTPHPGEMKRLLGHLGRSDVPNDEAGRIELCGHAARTLGSVVILKGHRSVVSDGQRYRVNNTGDNSLAKAGTGDVLSGLIGALLGQGMSPFDAAICGAHYHGLAGEAAGRAIGSRAALAREVADRLALVMHQAP